MQTLYWPYYCEENVWHLCQDLRMAPGMAGAELFVAFVTNDRRRVLMQNQKAAPLGQVLLWDYHVICLSRGGPDARGTFVWDRDSRLDLPCPASEYCAMSFSTAPEFAPYQPSFRWISADEFSHNFGSQRTHMRRADGSWEKEPPPWAKIDGPIDLPRFLDLRDPEPGEVIDLAEFKRRCAMS